MIGLKQKILFQSKQANTDIHYDPKTIQQVFLHSIYQGLGSKQQLRPLITNSHISDEEIVSQVMKIINSENEHQRRLGNVSRQKETHTNSVRVDGGDQTSDKREQQTIQQLGAQVETLTNMVAALIDQQKTVGYATHSTTLPVEALGQPNAQPHTPLTSFPSQLSHTRKGKMPVCTKCSHQGAEDCDHCFVCGEPGHRAVGCFKRTRQQGNGNQSLMRDNQRPVHSSSPTQ